MGNCVILSVLTIFHKNNKSRFPDQRNQWRKPQRDEFPNKFPKLHFHFQFQFLHPVKVVVISDCKRMSSRQNPNPNPNTNSNPNTNTASLTFDQISRYFSLPLNDAASTLGTLSLSAFYFSKSILIFQCHIQYIKLTLFLRAGSGRQPGVRLIPRPEPATCQVPDV